MNSSQLTYLLNNPEKVTKDQLQGLEELLAAYPYFQPARALYLKGLKNEESISYNKELKKTAAYTTDRSVLFQYITSDSFLTEEILYTPIKKPIEEEIAESKIEMEKAEAILNPYLFERKVFTEASKTPEEILEIEKPLVFDKNDTHSFVEWLKLTSAKPIQREDVKEETPEPKETEREEKFKKIDKFIRESPRIDPKTPTSPDNLAKPFSQGNDSLMTETLAKVYVQQKNYKKAIQAYKILILKNPEKSGFFADQIRAINNLQENNT